MNAKSAPLTPRSTKTSTNINSTENSNFSTQRSNTRRKMTSQRRSGTYYLPPASRTTIALNPNFNEFTDPTELTLISRELKHQIVNARRELIPYKEELRRLQYFYNPNAYDPAILSMTQEKNDLETEKREVDDELNLNRRACQGSIFTHNELQNETLKQEYHERCIILERIEAKLDKKKEKLDQILNSQTAEDIVEANSQIKKLTNKLKELKEEGNNLYVQNLKQLSTVGSTQTKDSQKLQPYRNKLSSEQHNVEKKKGELRTMRNQHQKKVAELKQSIAMKKENEKRVKRRDTWKQRLNLANNNNENDIEEYDDDVAHDYDYEEEELTEHENYSKGEEEGENETLNENEINPPKSLSARSPRRIKLNDIDNCSKTAFKNSENDLLDNEEEEEFVNKNEEEDKLENEHNEKNNDNEEEEEEHHSEEEGHNSDKSENDTNCKRDPSSTSNKSEETGNAAPLEDLAQNLTTIVDDGDNDKQKGLTQPPPKA